MYGKANYQQQYTWDKDKVIILIFNVQGIQILFNSSNHNTICSLLIEAINSQLPLKNN